MIMTVWNLVQSLTLGSVPVHVLLLGARPEMSPSSSGSTLVWVGIIGAVVVGVVVALVVLTRVLHQQGHNSQAGLFAGLCSVHALPRNSRALLKQLAASYNLSAAPARVFTEPRWLEPNPSNGLFRQRGPELAALREQLFGDGPNAETPKGS
ncbi:MAG: hypothetical protein ABFD16_05610 [Thermoguttaceae bacterium]